MKALHLLLVSIAFIVFSSFSINEACNYAVSNMSFVQSQTEKALIESDINKVRYHTFKAIKAIQANNKNFNECDCKEAEVGISKSLINLKAAVRSTSLEGTHILLKEALSHIIDITDALAQHEMHVNTFTSKEFAMNTDIPENGALKEINTNSSEIYKRIDDALLKYEKSLEIVMSTVNCAEARSFANKVFLHCEQQLLRSNLSEAKKYYNLRTKKITERALADLKNCGGSDSK